MDENYARNGENRAKFEEYLAKRYHIFTLKNVENRLEKMYDELEPNDLLKLYMSLESYLNQLHAYNIARGKKMINLMAYEMAVVQSKIPEYKKKLMSLRKQEEDWKGLDESMQLYDNVKNIPVKKEESYDVSDIVNHILYGE